MTDLAGQPVAPHELDLSATVPLVLTQPTPPPTEPGGRGEEFGKSSPLGLLVLLVFFIAVIFLVRSMTKHLRRVPASFDKPDGDDAPPDTDSPPNGAKPA